MCKMILLVLASVMIIEEVIIVKPADSIFSKLEILGKLVDFEAQCCFSKVIYKILKKLQGSQDVLVSETLNSQEIMLLWVSNFNTAKINLIFLPNK